MEWKEAWAKVNPKEKLPEVDFAKHFLLVSAQDAADPNRRGASVLKDDKGVVTVSEISTLIGFKPSDQTIYHFYKVSREGVTGVRRFDPAQKKLVVDRCRSERTKQTIGHCRAGRGLARERPRKPLQTNEILERCADFQALTAFVGDVIAVPLGQRAIFFHSGCGYAALGHRMSREHTPDRPRTGTESCLSFARSKL